MGETRNAAKAAPDQRYDNAYLFGAICPARGLGAALALPYADTDMMRLHLDEISRTVVKGAHAVLLLDRAGWHTTGKRDVPENITTIFLPSRAPELNGKRLAVSSPELALKHRLRQLRRHCRRRMRRVAKADRRARKDHIHRNARLGPHRSAVMTFGITVWRIWAQLCGRLESYLACGWAHRAPPPRGALG